MNEPKKAIVMKPSRSPARRVLRWALAGLAVLLGLVLVFLLYTILTAPRPDLADVSPDGYRSTVLDDDGEEMVMLVGAESNRVYVTLEDIPTDLQNAFIAIEDERFWQHHGVDLQGVLRAAWHNVTSGSLSQGASTLTQQLIKNNVFDAGAGEQTALDKVRRKLQEQYLALRLERQTSKEWVLENYLNTINLGGGTWGVQTAAQRYFGKDVGDLTLSECAVLAGITQSPNYYNPLKNPEANRQRQELVLAKMLELGMISQYRYEEALADDVYDRLGENSTATVTTDILSYFEDALVYQVLDDLMDLGYAESDAWNLLYRGGLTICSTQDSQLQAICEEEINRDDWYSSDAQATVVVTDPATGAVRAIVGGRGEKTGSLTLDRATSSVRQPGSVIKIIGEYAAALEQGAITLGSVLDDAPTSYSDGTAIRNASGTYGGRTTIRSAIAQSTNVVALKCFQEVGVDAVWSSLQAFGLQHLTDADRVEALALGGTHGGVTNLELTAAYGALANGGTYIEPSFYTRVLDREGNVLLEKTPSRHTAVSAETAALLTCGMEEVLTSGTGTRAAFSGMALAGKSGTTTDLRDLWFVGYSPYYACGVWGGFDDNSAQSSSAYVKSIWKAVMQRAHQDLAYQSFDTSALTTRTICTKCGELAVDGLCNDTVQGDMTQREYFASGTAPTADCTCHVAVQVCQSSGQLAGRYCPDTGVETSVYLRSGTAGTADAEALVPAALSENETCQVHQHWWSWMFPDAESGGSQPDEPDQPDTSDEPDEPASPWYGGWRDWFSGWSF